MAGLETAQEHPVRQREKNRDTIQLAQTLKLEGIGHDRSQDSRV